MEILCVIDSLGPGGAQRQLVELAKGFKEKGYQVSFLIYHNYPFYNSVLGEDGIKVILLQEKNLVTRVLKIRYYIRHGKFDAVISFLEGPNFICEIAGFPFRRWNLVVGERSANPNISKSLKQIVFRWFHLLADYVISNSAENKKYVQLVNPFLKNTKCKVIYNIVDFNRWKPLPINAFKKKNKTKIIIASSHRFIKNLNGLVEALLLFDKDELTNIEFHWYGDNLQPPYYDNSLLMALEKIKKNNLTDVMFFYPATHEITKKVQEADAIGLFSLYEGLPNIVCEGMACGKPIICSAISDLPVLLSNNKGLLFNPEDPQSIKQALVHLLSLSSDELFQIGNLNISIARKLFDKTKIIDSYLLLFDKYYSGKSK